MFWETIRLPSRTGQHADSQHFFLYHGVGGLEARGDFTLHHIPESWQSTRKNTRVFI